VTVALTDSLDPLISNTGLTGVVLLLLLLVALLLFSSVSGDKVEENQRYHKQEGKYDPEESLIACAQIYRAHGSSSSC
jgi:hypothetical protein